MKRVETEGRDGSDCPARSPLPAARTPLYAYADVVQGDILVRRGETGTPGILEAVVTTDPNR